MVWLIFQCLRLVVSVAIGNGNDEVKQAASYVTDDVDQDGLYNAFKYLKLI